MRSGTAANGRQGWSRQKKGECGMSENVISKKGLTGSTLKLVAIVTMFMDHFAAVVLDRYLIATGFLKIADMNQLLLLENRTYFILYMMDIGMRLIGRLGFPIFCFLLIEGFDHTRSRAKYAARLSLFALISEIPFDLGFHNQVLEFTYQNVFFTLCIGLLTIWGLDVLKQRMNGMEENRKKQLLQGIGFLLITAAGMAVAWFMKTDYDALGVLTIVVIFLFHKKSKGGAMAAGCAVLTIAQIVEFTSFMTVPLVVNYNGKRGWNLKYVFYLFYPVHILLLHLICLLLGV